MSDLPAVSLLLGPQTHLTLVLNALIRENRRHLAKNGISAFPTRLGSPLIRRCTDGRPAEDRKDEFDTTTKNRPVFVSALNSFGSPNSGFHQREIFPDAEKTLAQLSDLLEAPRILVGIDRLPEFFLATGSDRLEKRVSATGWEALYELSWADLIGEISDALPHAEVLIVTPGMASRSFAVLDKLFGQVAAGLPDRHVFLTSSLNETGRKRLAACENPDTTSFQAELFKQHEKRPAQTEISNRLCVDKVTRALLDQRFQEDLDIISGYPNCEIL